MADLKKWFPFKFHRNQGKQDSSSGKGKEVAVVPASQSLLRPGFPSSIQHLMEQMFSDPFFTRPGSMFGEMDRFFGDFAPMSFSPSIDLVDEGSHVRVSAELPGLDKDDIELSVHEGAMTLRGTKKYDEHKEEEGCYRTERYFGSFQRTVPLPVDVDVDKAEAKFEKGVLKVRFPKLERTETQRKITVG